MRNPFLLGLFDSLAHTDHRTAPVDVRTVLREHGGLQAFQSAADPDRWLMPWSVIWMSASEAATGGYAITQLA